MIDRICRFEKLLARMSELSAPLISLLARVYLANVFFSAGLTKIANWQSTMYLFEHEYSVPLLSPTLAACLGTGAELILPIFIFLGFGGRLFVIGLFIFNLVATISYEFLWTADGHAGLNDHLQWGLLLLLLWVTNYGKISVDYWIKRKLCSAEGPRV